MKFNTYKVVARNFLSTFFPNNGVANSVLIESKISVWNSNTVYLKYYILIRKSMKLRTFHFSKIYVTLCQFNILSLWYLNLKNV